MYKINTVEQIIFSSSSLLTFAEFFNTAASKGRQILPGGSKTRSAQQAGYFDKKFVRVMEGESYSDPVSRRRQDRIKQSSRNIGKAFVPSQPGKEV